MGITAGKEKKKDHSIRIRFARGRDLVPSHDTDLLLRGRWTWLIKATRTVDGLTSQWKESWGGNSFPVQTPTQNNTGNVKSHLPNTIIFQDNCVSQQTWHKSLRVASETIQCLQNPVSLDILPQPRVSSNLSPSSWSTPIMTSSKKCRSNSPGHTYCMAWRSKAWGQARPGFESEFH